MGRATTHQAPRDFGLDVIRVIAISAVLLTHAVMFFPGQNVITWGVAPALGFIGVELFFGLSGYLIGSMLIQNKYKLRVFYIRRLSKILPPYLFILGLVTVFALLAGTNVLQPLLAHLFFVQTFSPEMAAYFPVSWSLAIEFWFYVLVPLLLLNPIAKRKDNKLLWLCLGVLAAMLVARLLYVAAGNGQWEFMIHRFVPLRFDTLLFGVVAAVIVQRHPRIQQWFVHHFVGAVSLVLVVAACAYFGSWYMNGLYFTSDFWFKTVGLSVVALGIMGLVLWSRERIAYPKKHTWIGQAVTWFSKISYSVYLVHLFVYLQVATWNGPPVLMAVIAFVASVGLSWLSFAVVEQWAVKLRGRLEERFAKSDTTN